MTLKNFIIRLWEQGESKSSILAQAEQEYGAEYFEVVEAIVDELQHQFDLRRYQEISR
jgi:hypothetical protein